MSTVAAIPPTTRSPSRRAPPPSPSPTRARSTRSASAPTAPRSTAPTRPATSTRRPTSRRSPRRAGAPRCTSSPPAAPTSRSTRSPTARSSSPANDGKTWKSLGLGGQPRHRDVDQRAPEPAVAGALHRPLRWHPRRAEPRRRAQEHRHLVPVGLAHTRGHAADRRRALRAPVARQRRDGHADLRPAQFAQRAARGGRPGHLRRHGRQPPHAQRRVRPDLGDAPG
jgi:hypothetical protein